MTTTQTDLLTAARQSHADAWRTLARQWAAYHSRTGTASPAGIDRAMRIDAPTLRRMLAERGITTA